MSNLYKNDIITAVRDIRGSTEMSVGEANVAPFDKFWYCFNYGALSATFFTDGNQMSVPRLKKGAPDPCHRVGCLAVYGKKLYT